MTKTEYSEIQNLIPEDTSVCKMQKIVLYDLINSSMMHTVLIILDWFLTSSGISILCRATHLSDATFYLFLFSSLRAFRLCVILDNVL